MNGIKVGFDFDNTLSNKSLVRIKAYNFAISGFEVFIITKRPPEYSDEVYAVANQLRIPQSNIFFTSNGIKSPYIVKLGITQFYDDCPENKIEIEANSSCTVNLV